jgi:hypothetical protein
MAGEPNVFPAEELTPTTIKLFCVTLLPNAAERVVLPPPVALVSCTTVTAGLPNVKLLAERVTAGAATAVPVPVRLTVCGLPVALSVIVTKPLRVPAVVGVKVTLIMQFEPGLTVVPQVFVCAKSPLAATLEMLNDVDPLFVNKTLCVLLVVPTN